VKSTREGVLKRRGFLLASAAFGLCTGLGAMRVSAAAAKGKIGVIGAGRMGSILAKAWSSAGYDVMLSARDVAHVKELVANDRLGATVQAGTPLEAAAFGDAIVISVPYAALPQVGRDCAAQLKGKVVLDTCNPEKAIDGDMTKDALEKGTGAVDPSYLPGTRLVRAFNTVPYYYIPSQAHRSGALVAIPLAADDQGALDVAKKLVSDAGFEPVVVGGLSSAKSFDIGSPVYGKALTANQLRMALGIKS
jgi:hypothetical protein